MRLTIIADDKAVGVDGLFLSPIDLPQLDANIHAVQWYGDLGEVEYKVQTSNGAFVKPANAVITDVTAYQFAVDAWNAAKDAVAAAEKAAAADQSTRPTHPKPQDGKEYVWDVKEAQWVPTAPAQ